jgi:hypothetical protein
MSPYHKRIVLAWGSAMMLVAGPVGAAPSASSEPANAAPAAPAETAPNPAATDADTTAASPNAATPSASRGVIENGMTELGTLLSRARQSGDMVRVACVQDKNDRAAVVLEVATDEILVLQDPAADAQSRAFAGQKLGEAADRVSGLVSQARACSGGNDDSRRDSQNTANQPKTVIPTDPTSGGSPLQRLPPRIDPRPPVASPVL